MARTAKVGARRLRGRKAPALAGPKAKTSAKKAPATRRRKTNEARTAKVLDAGLELFSAYGFHGTRIEQVAERAELSKTNLLYYFSSKRALYEAVLHRILDIWLQPLRSLDTQLDPVTAIENYIRAKLVYSREQPRASKLFCLEVVQGADILSELFNDELRELVDSKVHVIRAWIADGRLAPIEPHHLLYSIWAITQHYADFAVQVEALTGESLADARFFEETVTNVRRIILDGIRPRQTERSGR
jgi:TetR/AcrR family transcriptional regulator